MQETAPQLMLLRARIGGVNALVGGVAALVGSVPVLVGALAGYRWVSDPSDTLSPKQFTHRG